MSVKKRGFLVQKSPKPKKCPPLHGAFFTGASRTAYGRIVLSALGVFVLVGAVWQGSRFFSSRNAPQTDEPVVVVEEIFRHPLTGMPSSDEAMVEPRQVFAVMVENSADAWPLSGLHEAFLLMEVPVEANIPRFVAFYSDETPVPEIGPVRSARPYFLSWVKEFDARYAHVGGSPQALQDIKTLFVDDLDEFYRGGTNFWRDHQRYAPHNTYTSGEYLRNDLPDFTEEYGVWKFSDAMPATLASAQTLSTVSLDWDTGALYDIEWKMHDGRFERFQNGVSIKMRDGSSLFEDNLFVLETDIAVIDSIGRREIRTTGEGRAFIVTHGVGRFGSWAKDAHADRLRFYEENGDEVLAQPGSSWIGVTSDLSRVSFTTEEE